MILLLLTFFIYIVDKYLLIYIGYEYYRLAVIMLPNMILSYLGMLEVLSKVAPTQTSSTTRITAKRMYHWSLPEQ